MAGIKEISEAIIGINEVGIEILTQFKDGIQFGDFEKFYMDFMQNSDFKAKVQAAYQGVSAIPAEISDLDLSEGLQLAGVQLGYLPRIVEALKK